MAAKNQLKEKYRKFCLAFRATGGNGTEAAIRAGYSEKTAAQAASRLLKNVKVQQYLEELAKDAARKGIITIENRQQILSKVAKDDSEDTYARIRAIDVLNKMDGVYVTKLDVTINGSLAVKLKGRRQRCGK